MPNTKKQHRDVYLCIKSPEGPRKLVWLSFQKSGHVSIGFFDKNFTVPKMVDGDGYVMNLGAEHGIENVQNPHFTLHSVNPGGAHFHLKSGSGVVLVEGLVWTCPTPGLSEATWVRFISSPISELELYRGAPNGRTPELKYLNAPTTPNCSVQVHVDFARPNPDSRQRDQAGYFNWCGVSFRVVASGIPAQQATLGYMN